jgi:hypothetical protein
MDARAELDELRRLEELETKAAGGQPAAPSSTLTSLAGNTASGFNEGFADVLGLPVDLVNSGMKALGIPTSDTPVFGSEFIKKYMMPEPFEAKTPAERVMRRVGKEIGGTVPFAAAGVAAGATRAAGKAAGTIAEAMPAGETAAARFANVPTYLVEELSKVNPATLTAIETALASGAGLGAGLMKELFPQGGPMAEFVGELAGGVAPPALLGLVRRAGQAAAAGAKKLVGFESEEATKQRLGKHLDKVSREGKVEQGVQDMEAIQQEMPGLKPTAGQATGEPGLIAEERALEKSGAEMTQKFRVRLGENRQVVREYFEATAPDGDPLKTITELQRKRDADEALMNVGLARTEAKINTLRGNVSEKTKQVLDQTERLMQQADERIAQRLESIGPKLTAKQQGEIIRQEYDQELTRFRLEAAENYDQVGEARLTVANTKRALQELDSVPPRLRIKDPVPANVRGVIDRLGTDHELQLRAEKAMADLEIRDASGPGFRTTDDFGRVVGGQKRGTPQWYKDLTLGEDGRPESKRETIENALRALRDGQQPGETGTLAEVAAAIRRDREFRSTPFHDEFLEHVDKGELSESFSNLRQVRSELKASLREAKAADDETTVRALNKILDGVEADMNELLPAGRFGGLYPDQADAYARATEHYVKGVERLKRGAANQLRLKDRYGNYRVQDDDAAKLFLRNETTIDNFQHAFSGKAEAQRALSDAARLDFWDATIKPATGQLDRNKAARWMQDHEHVFKAAPELRGEFLNASKMQQGYEQQKAELKALAKDPEKFLRLSDPKVFDQLSATEKQLARAQEVVKRTNRDFERSAANFFLKADVNHAAAKILTNENPAKAYQQVHSKVKGDADAVKGLQRAVWDAMQDKIESQGIDTLTGDRKLMATKMSDFLRDHADLVKVAFGEEKAKRLRNIEKALTMLQRSETPIGSAGSDTAANVQIQAQLPVLFSRAFAIASGRTSATFGIAERAGRFLSKHFSGLTQEQQRAILDEAFFDPKVMQTLILSAQGASEPLIRRRLHTHLLNMNLADEGESQ